MTKLGIPVSVMEPLKGGTLVRLTPEAKKVFEKANPKASIASWGLRYVASLPNVQVVLSGMSALGCVVNRFVLYYANVKKGYRENGECIRTT